ncbi:MAG: Hsp33 family molecular chaperone HslO [Pseudanabaenaceae cyanobacterium]
MADEMIRVTAANGGIRAVGITGKGFVEEARQRHKLSAVGSAALGQAMIATLLLASSMKTPQARVSLQIMGDGPLGKVFADAGADGTVRGFVKNPHVEIPLTDSNGLDVGQAIGHNGFLCVIRDEGIGIPYTSTVELASGEVGQAVAHYLFTSEQTPSVVLVGVHVNSEGIEAAGGALLQLMPQEAENNTLIDLLEERVRNFHGFSRLLREGSSPAQILVNMLEGLHPEVLPEVKPLRFACPCSLDRVLSALRMLSIAELREMMEKDGGAEVVCQFCGKVYHIDRFDLGKIIMNMEAR